VRRGGLLVEKGSYRHEAQRKAEYGIRLAG
jgi:hypothetical protein